jgi:hypothetical protein
VRNIRLGGTRLGKVQLQDIFRLELKHAVMIRVSIRTPIDG